jgi:hypothetical protein
MDEIIDKLAKQILAQGTKGWTGEGFGSAEANAKDMARILAQAGITDINQFGTKIVDVPESRIFVDDEFGGSEQVTPASQRRIYYNKATDQEIMPNYSRAGGNIWSGTFSGKGSTGYGVRFDDKGNPQFYTEYGGTTSDWVPFRENILKPAALAAAAIYGIPLVSEALTGAAAGAGAGAAGAAGATAAELAAAAELASAAGTAAGTAGTLGTASAIPNILVTTGKLAPVMTAAEIAALAAPVTAGLLSTPTVAEPTTNIEVTGAKIKPPVDGIFPTIGAGLLGAKLVSGTGAKTTSKITPSDVIKGIGTAATVASLLSDGKKESGFDIVDVPSDWRSPTRTTGTSGGVGGVGGVGNVPIDFGTMELLRGTQWERLINPAIQRSSVQTAMPGVMPGQLVQPRSIPTQFVIDQIANQTVPIAPVAPGTAAGPSAAPVGTTGLNLYEPGYEQRFGVTPPGSFVVGGDGQRTPEELRTEYEKNVRDTALGGARYLQDLYNYQPTGRSAFGDLYTRALADPSLISRGANESIEDALLRLKANVREAEDRQAGREALRAQFEGQGGNQFIITGQPYGTDMTDPYMGASLGTALENLRRIQAQNPEYQDIQSVISALTGSPVSGVVPTAPTAPITMENVTPASFPTMPVTGGPGAVPKFPEAQLISAPDDFNMLRRMQEFRETVPAPQQISADVGLIPQFPQPVGVPLPYMQPQSYTPVGQPIGLESLIYALSNGQTDASAMV